MIAFRSASTDTNALSAVPTQIGLVAPTGMQDGDFLIAAISMAGASGSSDSVTVTAPPGWTLLRRVDMSSAHAGSLLVFYKFALSEPPGWSWALGSPDTNAAGVIAAYTGVDVFSPVDVEAAQAATSDGTTGDATAPSVITSLPQSISIAMFMGGSGTAFTAPAGYLTRGQSSRSASSLALFEAQVLATGTISGPTSATDTSQGVISEFLVLRPSIAQSSVEEVRAAIKSQFPPGVDEMYDWDNTDADLYKLTAGVAGAYKAQAYDVVDVLPREFNPLTTVTKLPDWEAALGVTQTAVSKANPTSTYLRQNAVLSKMRQSGSATFDNVRATIEPLLGYQGTNIGTLEIVETNRAYLQNAHTYTNLTGFSVTPNGGASQTVFVSDDGVVSAAGVQLIINITTNNLSLVTATITGPTGTNGQASKAFAFGSFGTGAATNLSVRLTNVASSAGKTILGTWTMQLSTGLDSATVNWWSLFVEGATYDSNGHDGLGSEVFDWGVYADPGKVNNPDYVEARRQLSHIQPGYSRSHVFLTKNAIPDDAATLPGACYPSDHSFRWQAQSHADFSVTRSRQRTRLPVAVTAQFITSKLPLP